MTVADKYGQTTVEGCTKTLSELNGLNDEITVGEIRAFMLKRKAEKESDDNKKKRELIEAIAGKCFKFVFGDDHVELLYIKELETIQQYGEADANLRGESIVKYRGQIEFSDKHKSTYLSYFPNKGCEEITLIEFDKIKSLLKNINSLL